MTVGRTEQGHEISITPTGEELEIRLSIDCPSGPLKRPIAVPVERHPFKAILREDRSFRSNSAFTEEGTDGDSTDVRLTIWARDATNGTAEGFIRGDVTYNNGQDPVTISVSVTRHPVGNDARYEESDMCRGPRIISRKVGRATVEGSSNPRSGSQIGSIHWCGPERSGLVHRGTRREPVGHQHRSQSRHRRPRADPAAQRASAAELESGIDVADEAPVYNGITESDAIASGVLSCPMN